MEENKPIKVKKKDQKLFEELMDYEGDVDRRIATLLNEVGQMRGKTGQIHDDIWDGVVKRYKLDLSKGIWAYNRELKVLKIKPKTCKEKYDEMEEEKEEAEWEKLTKQLKDIDGMVDKMREIQRK